MTKKILVGLMGVIIVALAVSNYGLRKGVAQLQSECVPTKQQTAGEAGPTNEVVAEPSGDLQNATEGALAESSGERVDEAAAPTETKTNAPHRMMRSLSKMMENPAMNKMMVASQRGALDVMYADLADQFKLTGEEREHFMELLLARQMNLVDFSMKMMGGGLSDEDKKAAQAGLKEKNDLVKEELEYFLNNAEDVDELKFYEKTIQDRMMLSQMEQSLAESDSALSDATYRELLETMHEEKQRFDFTSDLADDENMDVSAERFSSENIENYATDLKSLNTQIIERARDILTPEQLELLIKSLADQLEMQVAQLEMAAQMFGQK